jgi:oligoendopeptidase F
MTDMTYTLSPWSLADLFPGHETPEMKASFEELEAKVVDFEGLRAQLSADISRDAFMGIVRRLEDISRLGNRIFGFANLAFAADTQDEGIMAFMGSAEQRITEIQNRVLFFSLWWKELTDADAARLMADAGDYLYWLEEMRHFKPHTLSEPEEKILNIKNVTGMSALQHLYDTITNGYVFKVEVDGEVMELTRGQLMVYVRQHDPELRAAAYREMYRIYSEDSKILGQMYQTLVRDWRNEQVDLRKFSSPIAARNLVNNIPDEVVDMLLEVCQRNAAVFQRFFHLKARWLKLDKLRRYDIYAPVAKSDKTYAFDAATGMVFDSFKAFAPRVAQLAQRVFDEHHLDSEVRKGKDNGAFCATIGPDLTPWVLVSFQGRADDVATLAHELGHAVHSLLADQHTFFTQHSSLPLAETASTFGEMLLIDKLLEEESDEAVRRDILFRQMDDSYATIMRQAYFALFERQAHEMTLAGASVSELAEAYLQNLKDQFGDSIEISDEFRWEWISIPHIYAVPFYVYAYAFGKLLVFSLYKQYKEEGEAFKPRYLKILEAGGSDSPEHILSQAGIDIRSADFWQGGFDVISELVDQLEALPIP